jgi:dipeptidyl aminopeptidase/acylaminoacyl peptidase
MLRDARATPAGQAAWRLYRGLFRPGEKHVWTAQDLEPTPDGTAVYLIGQCFEGALEDGASTSAWRLDVASGELSEAVAGARLFRISPDGQRAVCLSRSGEAAEQLQLLQLPRYELIEEVSIAGRVEAAAWAPDGSRLLLVVAGTEADISGAEGGFALRSCPEGASWLPEVISSRGGDLWRQILLWTPGAGLPIALTQPPVNVWEAAWLGDDRVLAIASDDHSEGSWYGASLRFLQVEKQKEIGRYSGRDQLGLPAGSPDGRHAAVIEAVCSDRGIICGSVRLMNGDGTGARALALNEVEVTDLHWRDSDRLLYCGLRDRETVVGEYDLRSAEHRELWSSDVLTIGGWYPRVAVFADDAALGVIENYNHAPAIARLGGGSADVIHRFEPVGGAVVPGRMEHFEWEARDGARITGWLILPEGDSSNLPLLVDVHGGPVAAHRNRYAAAFRAAPVLAEHGWAVFLPNPRGSGGRGQDFARQVVGDMGGEDAYDILLGVQKLVAAGTADPARLAIFGTSYGGFMAATMLAFHRIFAAAVAMSPVANWYSQHFASQIPWFDEAFLGGSPRQPGGAYFDRSAVFHLTGVTTPTLVIGGARDKNTPTNQAVELYNALREAGAAAELVIYPQDGHSMRGYPAYVDSAARVFDWLQRHVKG